MLEKCFQCCDRRDLETFPKPGKNEAGAAKAAFSTGKNAGSAKQGGEF